MTSIKTTIDRRTFLKVSALASGGMMLSFSWMTGNKVLWDGFQRPPRRMG